MILEIDLGPCLRLQLRPCLLNQMMEIQLFLLINVSNNQLPFVDLGFFLLDIHQTPEFQKFFLFLVPIETIGTCTFD